MKIILRKFLAVLVVIAVVFGWYVTIFGIGSLGNIKEMMKFGLDINGGVYVVLEADTDATGSELEELMDQTRVIINNRVNSLGISEATVSIEGENRLRVELPGVEDPEEAIEQIGKTASLRFLLADGTEVLSGSDVEGASISTDSVNGGYLIILEFTTEGTVKFIEGTTMASSGEVTSTIDGVSDDAIVIMLDDEIIAAPSCESPIYQSTCSLTNANGGYTKEVASNMATLINGGTLPLDLYEVESSVQTATIGTDALDKSIIAGVIGLAIIFILMLFMYKILGLMADIALLLYVVIVLWIMVALESVLTLPGIAGIILSIGMAVDANVIIFARIREEIVAGKTVRVAVSQGFKRALVTVLDAQITTLIAAVVLYEIGSTSVKGFALTLMIGIIVSIFTAVFVTHLLMGFIVGSKTLAKNKYFGVNEDGTQKVFVKKQFRFMNMKKITYTVSCGILALGVIFAGVRGLNYGIDFTGGTMLQIDMGQQVSADEVIEALSDFDLDPSVVLAGEDEEEVIIKTIEALDSEERTQVLAALGDVFGVTEDDVLALEQFGPTVGSELKWNAVKSVVIAAIGMLIYVGFRFKSWKYGVASILGVIHDALIVLAFYAIFGITVNNPFIAGILTVVGYSINDTIVIFDRIRENRQIYKKNSLADTVDLSINQTLNRSIMTSLTTLIVMVPMTIMVSTSIREFVIPLMVGVIVGTYSSICLCSPLLCEFSKKEEASKYKTAKRGKSN